MDVSIALAKILGFYFTIASLYLLLNYKHFPDLVSKFASNKALILFSGFMALIMGLTLITIHNLWIWRWPLVITVIAWLILVIGIIRIFFPKFAILMAMGMCKSKTSYYVNALITLLVGAYLIVMSFMHPL